MMVRRFAGSVFLGVIAMGLGCRLHSLPSNSRQMPLTSYKRLALSVLKRGMRYEHNAVVRVQAAEALQGASQAHSWIQADSSVQPSRRSLQGRGAPVPRAVYSQEDVTPWLRAGLQDEHPAVRFACGVSLGVLRDPFSAGSAEAILKDRDPSVRLAAVFVLHRAGQTDHTGKLADALLFHEEPLVRRNAALLLGLLGEGGGIRVLAKAMRDTDEGVRNHALEAMASLGVQEAAQQLRFLVQSGVGSQEVFAINALARMREAALADVFRAKLRTGAHLETRLAAAGALGKLGHADGYALALRSLMSPRTRRTEPEDSPEAQRLRIRILSASALGSIGDSEALPALADVMENSSDPRVKISAAGAIIQIVRQARAQPLPVGPTRR